MKLEKAADIIIYMKRSVILLLFFSSFLSLFAQNDGNPADSGVLRLSVDDSVELAKKNNVSIAREKITLAAALRSKNHSWNSVSPSASVSASSSLPIDALSDSKSDYTANFGLSATLSVSLSTNLYTSMKSACLAYESGRLSFEDAVRAVELGVREAFYTLLYEKENIVLQEQNLEIARAQYANNLARYNQGRLSEIDVLSAEVNYKSKIPSVESARTIFLNDLDSFKQALGLHINERIELEGSLDELINLNEISVRPGAISSSSVRNLELRLAAAENAVLDRRFSAFAPSMSASFNWSDRYWYLGHRGNPADPEKSALLTLSASIPLDGALPWSVRNDAIDSAKDSVRDLELQLDNERKNLKRGVDSSLRSIKQSQESIKYKQANVILAQRTYDMTQEAYGRGTRDLLTLQDANASLLNAQVSLKSETLTLIKAILGLENIIGVPFGTLGK